MENQADDTVAQTNGQQTSASVRQKYGVSRSLQDMMGAVKRNPITFVVSLVVSYALSGVVLTLTFLGFASLLLGQFGLLFASVGKLILILVVGLVVYTLLYALVYAFTVSCIAYSLSSDKNSIGATLRKALHVTVRVVKVNALVAVYAYWPVAVAAFLPLILLSGPRLGGSSIALLSPILILAAGIWALIAQLRYALAPQVAIFEPDLSIKQTLKRSESLLKKGGQWFIFKGVLMILAVIILLAVMSGSTLRQLENSNDLPTNIIFILISILVEGALIMLYFNRSNKQSATKSRGLMAMVIVVLISLLGLAALNGQNNKQSGSFSQADQQAFMQIANDVERKTDIKSLAGALENYYNEQGYYPAPSDVANTEWTAKNLKQTVGSTMVPLRDTYLTDPNGKYINAEGADYQYKVKPENCTKCASFELSAKLEKGDEYKQVSLNSTVKTTNNPPQAQATNIQTSTSTPSPQPTDNAVTVRETYRIAADGNSAQRSPVTTTLSDVATVDLTIDLQCLGTCQFKLVSDTYSFSNTTTYTSSQKIKYQITQPGEYIFYNQFTPSAKFKIKF